MKRILLIAGAGLLFASALCFTGCSDRRGDAPAKTTRSAAETMDDPAGSIGNEINENADSAATRVSEAVSNMGAKIREGISNANNAVEDGVTRVSEAASVLFEDDETEAISATDATEN